MRARHAQNEYRYSIRTMSLYQTASVSARPYPLLFGVDKIPSVGAEQDTLDAFEQFCRADRSQPC